MSLYVAEHRHSADRCPAANPQMAAGLLQLLSPAGAKSHGVTIQSEAVARGKHHLYLILDAPDESRIRQYLAPFAQAGSLDVFEASSCATVVQRGSC